MKQAKNKIKRLIALGLLFTLVIGIAPNKSMAASANTPKLKNTTMRIEKGKSQKIKIVNIKTKQIKKVTYSSSKKSVAKVSKNGNVTGVKSGKATIICKVTLKNKKRYTLKAKVTVKKPSTTHVHTLRHYKQVPPTCTQNGVREHWHCSGCGKNYSDKNGIAEISSTTISAKGHTSGEWIIDREATETSEGSRHISCVVCGKKLKTETISKINHVHTLQHHKQVASTCTQNGVKEHWHCSGCNKNYSDENATIEISSTTISAKGHISGEWIIDKEATADSEGSRHISCTVCGEKLRTETIPKIDHVHTLQYHNQVAPTCTQNGVKEHWHCSGCNKNYSDENAGIEMSSTIISAKGHTSGEWIIDKEATETSEGSRHISCTVCGEKLRTETIPKLQAQKLSTTTYTINNVDFKMILVEAGTFIMGSDNTNTAFGESPAHKVTLTRDYLMGETEVTEALWNAVMGNGGGSNTHPKTSITWKEAHTFVDRLTEIAQEQGFISSDVRFRMPTEAQWEFAAKGGNQSKGYLYSGSNNINEVAVTLENSGSSSPLDVKTKLPNELGLYDMSGNAYEWVDDYGGNYSAEEQVDPQNTTVSSQYVKRGGSNYHNFSSESYLFTTTGRYFYGSTDWTIGLRICLY